MIGAENIHAGVNRQQKASKRQRRPAPREDGGAADNRILA
jgi:hypothetical protein